ncbi:MAG: TRAP transporter small permease subunit [Hyphomonadaceae bacterium]
MSAKRSGLTGAFDVLAAATVLIASAALASMVAVLAWQVIGRYVLNSSPAWTEPVALTLMSISALFGAAIAVRAESHFSFPTLVETAPALVRALLRGLARLIALAFGLALAAFGFVLMADGWSTPMAGAPAPEGLSYAGIAFGGALIAVFALERLISGSPPEAEAGEA